MLKTYCPHCSRPTIIMDGVPTHCACGKTISGGSEKLEKTKLIERTPIRNAEAGSQLPQEKKKVMYGAPCSQCRSIVNFTTHDGKMIRNAKCRRCGSIEEYKTKEEIGNELWSKIHSYEYKNREETQRFYGEWQAKIPSFGCQCKSDWAEIVRHLPPQFDSAESFFKWSVDAHNAVNRRLKKPQMELEDAIRLWKSPDVSVNNLKGDSINPGVKENG